MKLYKGSKGAAWPAVVVILALVAFGVYFFFRSMAQMKAMEREAASKAAVNALTLHPPAGITRTSGVVALYPAVPMGEPPVFTVGGRYRSRGVIIDVTALDVMDSFAVRTLRDIAHMARLRGAETVIVGIQPEVVAFGYPLSPRMKEAVGQVYEGLRQDDLNWDHL